MKVMLLLYEYECIYVCLFVLFLFGNRCIQYVVVLDQGLEPCVIVLGVEKDDMYHVLSGYAEENR